MDLLTRMIKQGARQGQHLPAGAADYFKKEETKRTAFKVYQNGTYLKQFISLEFARKFVERENLTGRIEIIKGEC